MLIKVPASTFKKRKKAPKKGIVIIAVVLVLIILFSSLSRLNGISFEKLEFLGFDACLMASVEIASMLAPYANYYIASEKTEPGTGWNYAFMSVLNNSGMNGVGADYKNGDLQIVQAPIDKDKNDYYCIFHIYDVYGNVTVSELIPFSEQIS